MEKDLRRAGIFSKWWIINSSFYLAETTNKILRARAAGEIQWINKISEATKGNVALIKSSTEDLKGEKLSMLLE